VPNDKGKAVDSGENIIRFDPAQHIKIAADSIERLRRCDVFRVLDSCPEEHRQTVSNFIFDKRRDLQEEVSAVMADLATEAGDETADDDGDDDEGDEEDDEEDDDHLLDDDNLDDDEPVAVTSEKPNDNAKKVFVGKPENCPTFSKECTTCGEKLDYEQSAIGLCPECLAVQNHEIQDGDADKPKPDADNDDEDEDEEDDDDEPQSGIYDSLGHFNPEAFMFATFGTSEASWGFDNYRSVLEACPVKDRDALAAFLEECDSDDAADIRAAMKSVMPVGPEYATV